MGNESFFFKIQSQKSIWNSDFTFRFKFMLLSIDLQMDTSLSVSTSNFIHLNTYHSCFYFLWSVIVLKILFGVFILKIYASFLLYNFCMILRGVFCFFHYQFLKIYKCFWKLIFVGYLFNAFLLTKWMTVIFIMGR